jgi:hypothetical protein
LPQTPWIQHSQGHNLAGGKERHLPLCHPNHRANPVNIKSTITDETFVEEIAKILTAHSFWVKSMVDAIKQADIKDTANVTRQLLADATKNHLQLPRSMQSRHQRLPQRDYHRVWPPR